MGQDAAVKVGLLEPILATKTRSQNQPTSLKLARHLRQLLVLLLNLLRQRVHVCDRIGHPLLGILVGLAKAFQLFHLTCRHLRRLFCLPRKLFTRRLSRLLQFFHLTFKLFYQRHLPSEFIVLGLHC